MFMSSRCAAKLSTYTSTSVLFPVVGSVMFVWSAQTRVPTRVPTTPNGPYYRGKLSRVRLKWIQPLWCESALSDTAREAWLRNIHEDMVPTLKVIGVCIDYDMAVTDRRRLWKGPPSLIGSRKWAEGSRRLPRHRIGQFSIGSQAWLRGTTTRRKRYLLVFVCFVRIQSYAGIMQHATIHLSINS